MSFGKKSTWMSDGGIRMERFLDWWKREERYVTLIKSLLLLLLPLACCAAYCGAQGHWIGEVYLPSSQWNDELFYYKQVEGILSHGYPQGYFGFNESHALKLSFAAWSPVLVFPWVIWGLLFGWNLSSPVICNIVLLSLACFLYVWLVKPSWKQLGAVAFLFCLYNNFARYMLSGMPEALCFVMLILFYSLAVSYLRRRKDYKIAVLFLMSCTMTLMRPYLALFLLLPAYFWISRERTCLGKWLSALGSLLVMGVTLGIYACIKHYLGAEYLTPLFFTDWIEAFFQQGFVGGLRFTFAKLLTKGQEYIAYAKQGIRAVNTTGAIYAGYLICLFVLAVQCAEEWYAGRRSRRNVAGSCMAVRCHLAFCFLAMLPALLLMYKTIEGSRHLLTFMAAAVFLIPLAEARFHVKALCLGAVFAYLYIYRATDPYDYQVAYLQEEIRVSLEEWQAVFSESLVLEEENTPNYENVVIWTQSDMVEDAPVYTTWQLLYALPEGFGISCCTRDYVIENAESLKSRYLLGPAGGEIERLCEETGCRLLYGDGEMVLYEIP